MSRKHTEQFSSNTVFDIVNYTLLTGLALIFLYPLYFLVVASVSTPEAVWNGKVWLWPVGLNFEGYSYIFNNPEIWRSTGNTAFYTILGTVINLIMTVMAAYPLSRKEFMAKGFITLVYSITMFFGGGMIPTYLVVKNLQLLDTVWALVLPGAVSVWFIIITRTFFQVNIPNDVLEAAKIDGCSNVRCLTKIVLPLSGSIIATLALFFSVGHWNSFFGAFLYLNDRTKYPLQMILREIVLQSKITLDNASLFDAKTAQEKMVIAEKIKYAIIVFSSFPLLVAYPFVQKHFKKGVLIGSLKG